VLIALEAQESPFPFLVPSHWPKVASCVAKKRYESWHLPIQLVQLPTYSPWLNPIEKLWRKLKQEFIYMHRYSQDPIGLQQQVLAFLHQFQAGSTDLLQYVGLLSK
jgi:transposase